MILLCAMTGGKRFVKKVRTYKCKKASVVAIIYQDSSKENSSAYLEGIGIAGLQLCSWAAAEDAVSV